MSPEWTLREMARPTGLEPVTPGLEGGLSGYGKAVIW